MLCDCDRRQPALQRCHHEPEFLAAPSCHAVLSRRSLANAEAPAKEETLAKAALPRRSLAKAGPLRLIVSNRPRQAAPAPRSVGSLPLL